ncbi:MAG: hypothetical protein JJU46_14715 [Balneolaceae bacterium]|nr:hypothetical protein [Balneolaceae bacterium]MCH8549577.1 hypothetical protein [Balneolaceae bacterium]
MKLKTIILMSVLLFALHTTASAQIKEVGQLATLSPMLFVVNSSSIENYHKTHFTVSTIGYLGSYMVFDSKWKAALLTLGLGAVKEVVYDGLLNQGTPLWSDMKWNSLGVAQGFVFTVVIEF